MGASFENDCGQADSFSITRHLSRELLIFPHVDASRTLGSLTTLSHGEREQLGLPKLGIVHPFDSLEPEKHSEITTAAATIVAG